MMLQSSLVVLIAICCGSEAFERIVNREGQNESKNGKKSKNSSKNF